MIDQIANVTAHRLVVVILLLTASMWIGGKVAVREPSNAEYAATAAFLVGLAIVDHLHGIRQALNERRGNR